MTATFTHRRRVAFSDVDAAGIVHFSRYNIWMEDCEHAFLRSLGTSVHGQDAEGQRLFPRVHAEADYRAPLRFEDEVDITLTIQEQRRKVLVYAFTFTRGCDTERCAQGSTTVVFARAVQGVLTSAPLPDDLLAAMGPYIP